LQKVSSWHDNLVVYKCQPW